MTKEQADQIIMLLQAILAEVARTANATAKDGRYVFYPYSFAGVSQTHQPE